MLVADFASMFYPRRTSGISSRARDGCYGLLGWLAIRDGRRQELNSAPVKQANRIQLGCQFCRETIRISSTGGAKDTSFEARL